MWGDFSNLRSFIALTNVIAIAASQATFALAICLRGLAPMVAAEPLNQHSRLGGAAAFTDASGSQTSSSAALTLGTRPQITSVSPATQTTNYLIQGQAVTLSVAASPNDVTDPLSYEWQLNGTNLVGWIGSTYIVPPAWGAEGRYSVMVTNSVGTTNAGPWWVRAALPGMVAVWGDDSLGACDRPASLTNVAAIAVGGQHCVVAGDDGSVLAWGANNAGQTTVPGGLSGVVAVAAGASHSLALTSGGAVVAWGDNTYGQTNGPSAACGKVCAISAAANQSLALGSNGLVTAWGQTYAPVPQACPTSRPSRPERPSPWPSPPVEPSWPGARTAAARPTFPPAWPTWLRLPPAVPMLWPSAATAG